MRASLCAHAARLSTQRRESERSVIVSRSGARSHASAVVGFIFTLLLSSRSFELYFSSATTAHPSLATDEKGTHPRT